MAISPRTLVRNPVLLVIALVTLVGVGSLLSLLSPRPPSAAMLCDDPRTADAWAVCIEAQIDKGDHYRAATLANVALSHHNDDAHLLNLRGFAMAREGEHATALADFETGLKRTGSQSGVFENNIAWSRLYLLDHLDAGKRVQRLRQSRELYEQSMARGKSCARLHTAMFVEFAIADVAHEEGWHGVKLDAIRRYGFAQAAYAGCEARVLDGEAIVVEEVLSAAIVDDEMGQLAGVKHPTRHLTALRAAERRARELGVTLDASWCHSTHPVLRAANACAERF